MKKITRRETLQLIGGIGTAALLGCVPTEVSGDDSATGIGKIKMDALKEYEISAEVRELVGDALQRATIITAHIPATENVPNSPMPVVILKGALDLSSEGAEAVERAFHGNKWGNSWRNGVYSYHHYHSTAHESLSVYRGWVSIQFGGENGPVLKAEAGDVVVIPAGVAHKRVDSSWNYALVGAYPPGQSPDMKYCRKEEMAGAKKDIAKVALPPNDPIYGSTGPLIKLWK